MFCVTCGSALISGATACPKCGAPVPSSAPPAFAQQAPFGASSYPPQQFQPRPASSFPWGILVAIGCLIFFVIPVLAALLLPALAAARGSSRAVSCKNQLTQIGSCVALYRSRFAQPPPDLNALWGPDFITDPGVLICPVNGRKPAQEEHWRNFEEFSSRVSYEYRPPEPGAKTDPNRLMAWDRTPHTDGKRCVLYFSGRVEMLTEGDFQAELKAK